MSTNTAPTEEQITARAYKLMEADVNRPLKKDEKRTPLSWSAAQAKALEELTASPAPMPPSVIKFTGPSKAAAPTPAS